MNKITEITDFQSSWLDVYARLSEVQLLNRRIPENAMFIAESPKVIERALDAGYEPVSCLMEKRHIEGEGRPILDRIDICIHAPEVQAEDIGRRSGENTKNIREQVEKVREIQRKRYINENYRFNSEVPSSDVEKYCRLTDKAKKLMDKVYTNLRLSVRAYYKIVRVARTIADLDCSEIINEKHIAEAVGYRTEIF